MRVQQNYDPHHQDTTKLPPNLGSIWWAMLLKHPLIPKFGPKWRRGKRVDRRGKGFLRRGKRVERRGKWFGDPKNTKKKQQNNKNIETYKKTNFELKKPNQAKSTNI